MLLGTLGASLLGNPLTAKGIMRAGEGIIRADQIFNATSLFNKFGNTKLLSKRTKFNDVYQEIIYLKQ